MADYNVEYRGCGPDCCNEVWGFEFTCPKCGCVDAETETDAEGLFCWGVWQKNIINKPIILKCPDCGFAIQSEPVTEENRFLFDMEFKEVSNGQT